MTVAANLGFPRIGARRELKFALESFFSGNIAEAELDETARGLRAKHWRLQSGCGINHAPSGDFSFYDHVLDTACMLGAIPPGYGWSEGPVSLATYVGLARGMRDGPGAPALEMTKWFDTNYHYLVPRLSRTQRFSLTENRALMQWKEAASLSIRTRPVLLGPVSFLSLAKASDTSDPLDLLSAVLPVYGQILRELAQAGVTWAQIDEPVLSLDLTEKAKAGFATAYHALASGLTPRILLANYFGPLGDNLPTAASLPVAGLHLDLVRGASDLESALNAIPVDRWLSLGLVDGRNVWRTDLRAALASLQHVAAVRGARHLMVAPACSLLHVPVDLAQEDALDPEVKTWLAFAVQKLAEVAQLARGLDEGEAVIAAELEASDAAKRTRQNAARVHRRDVAERLAAVTPAMEHRASSYAQRRRAQQARLNLPLFPDHHDRVLPADR